MKVSVLTACHNCEPYLSDCIGSILRQQYSDWEMIIVDDASSDNSRKVIQKYAKRDDRIKLIVPPERLKCGGAYNLAMKNATGDICCVLDSDDALPNDKCMEKVVNAYVDHPEVDYIWTRYYICSPKLKKEQMGSSSLPPTSFLTAGIEYTEYRHAFSHWRTCRTCLRDKGLIFNPSLKAAVDKWMGYTLEELGVGGFIKEPLYLYRRRLGGLSFKGRRIWKNMMKVFKEKRDQNNIIPYKTKLL